MRTWSDNYYANAAVLEVAKGAVEPGGRLVDFDLRIRAGLYDFWCECNKNDWRNWGSASQTMVTDLPLLTGRSIRCVVVFRSYRRFGHDDSLPEQHFTEPPARYSDASLVKAMEKYGTDKPDLRFEMEIASITDLAKACGFSVFAEAIKAGGVVHALKVSGGAKFSRKEIDEITEVAQVKGAKGLAYIVIKSKVKSQKSKLESEGLKAERQNIEDFELQSPIVKFLGEKLAKKIVEQVSGRPGDIIFFGADIWKTVCLSLGAVRNECAARLGLKDNKKAAWCWVVDFPMYDYSEIEPGRVDFAHNPFSMPQGGLKALTTKQPFDILAYQYDLVINGFEASSGAIRNHDPEIMYQAFAIAGYSRDQVDKKFGAMIRAFEFGAPPHGGNAPGVDRILMVLLDLDSIRDIYAFPKDGQGKDLMTDSPSEVYDKQLKELSIKVKGE